MAISMEELRQQFYENLKKADSSEAFEQLRIRYLGKKGEITGLLKNMGQLAADQRKEYGQKVNELKEKAEDTKEVIRSKLNEAAEELKEKAKEAAEGVGLVKDSDKETENFEFEDFETEEDAKQEG